MNSDERALVQEMIAQCEAAKTAGVALLLVNQSGDTSIYACSSDDAKVVQALVGVDDGA